MTRGLSRTIRVFSKTLGVWIRHWDETKRQLDNAGRDINIGQCMTFFERPAFPRNRAAFSCTQLIHDGRSHELLGE
jgi:hypothetical protein